MNWIKIKVLTSQKKIDFVSGIFENAGIESLEIEDSEEFLQVLEQTRASWDFVEDELYEEKSKACSVSGYVPDNPDGRKILEAIQIQIKAHNLEILIATVNEEDWAENWKKYFKPAPVGKNILICPVWEEVPEEYQSRKIFRIEPGMSFGTGTHESTRLCITALEKYINQGDKILDLGCGSGILSIIAMILGAGSAVAVDIDANSVRIAEDNARINSINQNYKAYADDLLKPAGKPLPYTEQKYDIILMNIVPGVIIPLLPFVKDLLADRGVAILSGIIGMYLSDVENAVKSNGLEIIEKSSENDWQCVVAGK